MRQKSSALPICIAVINMKGGVGKTTVASLLGRYASMKHGLSVLAIDLDPQANLSQAFMGNGYRKFLDDKGLSIVEIFKDFHPPSHKKAAPQSLDLGDVIVRNTRLGGKNLEVIPSRFDFSDYLIESIGANKNILANLISREFSDKDIVIIDCAPTESIFTQVAYQASRYVLVPVRPEFFATIGFPLLNDSLSMFRAKNRGNLIDVAGVVINNSAYHYSGNRGGPERSRSIQEIENESRKNGWHVFENQMPFSRGFPKIMRGDFRDQGDAPLFYNFAEEFFRKIGAI